MPRKKNPVSADQSGLNVTDFRFDGETRKNIPPAKIASEGIIPALPKSKYYYSPRRPPILQFDPEGKPDKITELLQKARTQALSDAEIAVLNEALQNHHPWLEWAEKREQHERGYFEVEPLALHLHERISAKAILKTAAREDVTRDLFADPQQSYHEAIQFYKHDIDWTNRLILGDSLQVMSSLARREELAGKVQMIYIDPPYGIKFASNFQPEIAKRDVKDREQDLTREPEMVKAYRDTWHLGVHSYLSYLRDRLITARELLADSGSIFVQIGEENVHLVRGLLDDVFGNENYVSQIVFSTTAGRQSDYIDSVYNTILCYARSLKLLKYRQLYSIKEAGEGKGEKYTYIELDDGSIVNSNLRTDINLSYDARYLAVGDLTSQEETASGVFSFVVGNKKYFPGKGRHWSCSEIGLNRLKQARRIIPTGERLMYKRYLNDFPTSPFTNIWMDTSSGASRADPKLYIVQTRTLIIQRCLLMTTEPGDLVLDPTCGSGTTAYVAEQWGRRWITIDTSRVAISIARQRLLTSKFDYYKLRDDEKGIAGNFIYKTVPHITLKSIAQNSNLDPIFAKHEPILNDRLVDCNIAMEKVNDDLRRKLADKLMMKQKSEGKRSITDADTRRWDLPAKGKGWEHWEIPFDADEDYPPELRAAVKAYRATWQAKMKEVNACISANAEMEELVDKPEAVRGVVRVSGPFTVEAVQPPEMSMGDKNLVAVEAEGKFDGEPETLQRTFEVTEYSPFEDAQNVEAYLERMVRLLKMDGFRFLNNKQMHFTRLERLNTLEPGIHAEGRWVLQGQEDADPEGRAFVAVALGPQYGPVTAGMVEEVIRSASRMGYDDLVIAGFNFDGMAQTVIAEAQHPKLRIHGAQIAADANPSMQGLLKEQPGSHLFTAFGQPRTIVEGPDDKGEYRVVMEGIDIYDPVNNTIIATKAEKVAAWFLDSDWDGHTFCITQAFFPDKSAWERLARALKGVLQEEAFEALSGTISLPFSAGSNKCAAVKVIDPRGNEVMRVHKLEGKDV